MFLPSRSNTLPDVFALTLFIDFFRRRPPTSLERRMRPLSESVLPGDDARLSDACERECDGGVGVEPSPSSVQGY